MTRHFLDIKDLTRDELYYLLQSAHDIKKNKQAYRQHALHKNVACIFEKPSTRTRVSFEVGIQELGGHALLLNGGEMQFGFGETIADTARVLSRMVDMIMIRTHGADKLQELANYATIPVINGLTDISHPCQILADLLTVQEEFGTLENLKFCWVGDYNNVTQSLCEAANLCGFYLHLAVPKAYQPEDCTKSDFVIWQDTIEVAAKDADVMITDTWVSMNHVNRATRLHDFAAYQVNDTVMGYAAQKAIFLHCLPAHRDEEVTASVIDGKCSRVWQEAENRIHAQKAIMLFLLGLK